MEALELHSGAHTLNWEDNTSCISVVEAWIVSSRVKQIYIPVYFILEQFDNGMFIPDK